MATVAVAAACSSSSSRLLSPAGSPARPSPRCAAVGTAVAAAAAPAVPARSWRDATGVAAAAVVLPQQRRSLVVAASSGDAAAPAATTAGGPAAEGQVSSELMAAMEAKIKEALEAAEVRVADVHGDGRHVSIDVVSREFEGKTSVQRQRLVYKAIWLELQGAVHAVDAMTTRTPEEAAAAS